MLTAKNPIGFIKICTDPLAVEDQRASLHYKAMLIWIQTIQTLPDNLQPTVFTSVLFIHNLTF